MGENNSMFETLQDHETRIKRLEDSFTTLTNKMSTIENTQLTTQNILLTNKQEHDKLLNKIFEQNGEIVRHTLEIKKVSKEGFWKTAGIIVGSGGLGVVIIYGVIELVQKIGG
jgi:hypothetical protein